MNIWTRDDDGVRRLFGIPVGGPWRSDSRIVLRSFEPENPSLLVPRAVGIGWDFNLGAVAVHLGLIRPDDSLPDLNEYVPETLRRGLVAAPWIGAGVASGMALGFVKADRVATSWSLGGKPNRYTDGVIATLITAGATRAAALYPRWVGKEDGADIAATAQAMGIQTVIIMANLAARKEIRRPGSRQPLAVVGAMLAPVVMGGVLVGTVKVALDGVSQSLTQGGKERQFGV
ncbi:DUF5808 domain-containing protein [Cutibacterium avidum]|uniref:DUF5808 domain-containing protein n=1 Tax=Cutibacterium avidum TaxID=33010 RepID=UPI00083E85D6|nr:DUF5808 domain-containing protein [Cutibacterium avidum]AOG28621.1 hypothetical protein BFS79_09045 [Cutibacterium avidum]